MRLAPLLILLAACKGDPDDSDIEDTEVPGDGKLRVTILHTNDWQSHLLGIGPNTDYTPDTPGDDETRGGIARVKARVDEIRAAADRPVVLYDGGDWMAGALFQLLATSDAAELQMMQEVGYDAITLGNHEFDWGPDTLADIISTAAENGVTVPIIASNTNPDPAVSGDERLAAHFESGRIERTKVVELENGLRIGLFGLLGDEAVTVAPAAAPTKFTPVLDAAGPLVAELEAQDVDLVVALTHNGVYEDHATSPDEVLARAQPGIDVIVGGHSHTPLPTPIVVGTTTILQAGSHTKWLGQLDLAIDPETGEVETESYVLHEIDDSEPGDVAAQDKVDGFVAALDAGPLADLGVSFHEPMFAIPEKLPELACEESGLGNLITDAYRTHLTDLDPTRPIDFAFEAQGLIRESMYPGGDGVQGFSDIFNVMPLGFGQDRASADGYPLTHFYVTGAELRDACEVTATVAPVVGCGYFIELSGLRCTMDMSYLPSTRVHTVEGWDGDSWERINISSSDTTLYHIAVDSYIASLMSIIVDLTDGALQVTPKDAAGNPIANPADTIFDADPLTPGVQEVKLWEAIIAYGRSFPDTTGDGIPDLPARYATPEGRVVGYH